MLEQPARFLLIGSFALSFTSCAHFTSSGRAQLAYAHYVKKMSHNRVKVATKFKKVKVPKGQQEAEAKMTGTGGAPQSATSSQAGPQSTSAPEAAADRQPEASASPE